MKKDKNKTIMVQGIMADCQLDHQGIRIIPGVGREKYFLFSEIQVVKCRKCNRFAWNGELTIVSHDQKSGGLNFSYKQNQTFQKVVSYIAGQVDGSVTFKKTGNKGKVGIYIRPSMPSIYIKKEKGMKPEFDTIKIRRFDMKKHNIFTTSVSSVYPHYVAKAERKKRTKEEVDEIICWLTGYCQEELEVQLKKETDFENFFTEAPNLNPSRLLIKGVVCGIRVEEVEDPIMREIRYLDKLVDELAKGKAMEKILRKE